MINVPGWKLVFWQNQLLAGKVLSKNLSWLEKHHQTDLFSWTVGITFF
jgi:hypothetical protein